MRRSRWNCGTSSKGPLVLLKSRFAGQLEALDIRPAAAHGLYVLGNRIRLEQILINLFQNALEALGRPRRSEGRRLRSPRREDEVAIDVADNGPGISPAILKSLFTPFNTSKEKGLGLGLVISKDIVADYGGRIDVDERRKRHPLYGAFAEGQSMSDATPIFLVDDDKDSAAGNEADA